ncbi:uncharacterized protein C4orf45 homolog [Octodon degus]|uniref:Uncharacterized protein C4orf45 homolog n=1 Tax=Octodon degus TaxID=10160 RepID=A0A6P3VDX0_OCTDE|nr:uncharacterized protein C4orf45 homolog [Octodon degus]
MASRPCALLLGGTVSSSLDSDYQTNDKCCAKAFMSGCPDYKRDHLPKVQQHTSYIGEKSPESEKTGDLLYLWRPASDRSVPAKYKHEYVGEVGWGIPKYNFINKSRRASGFHIKYGELSLDAIDKLTHRFQNPWQPKPSILDQQGRYSRAFLAWHVGDHEDTHQRDSEGAALVRQSKSSPRKAQPPRLPALATKEEASPRDPTLPGPTVPVGFSLRELAMQDCEANFVRQRAGQTGHCSGPQMA